MSNLSLVLIPYWIKEVIEQQGHSVNVLVDYTQIKDVLSTEQKIELLRAQNLRAGLFDSEQLHPNPSALLEHWSVTGGEAHAAQIQEMAKEAARREARTDQALTQMRLSLQSEASTALELEELTEVLALGQSGACGLVLQPGIQYLTQAQYYQLVQNVLSVFYTYENSPYRVAQLGIFRTYLNLMRANRATSL